MIIEENLSDKENPRTLDMRTPRNDRAPRTTLMNTTEPISQESTPTQALSDLIRTSRSNERRKDRQIEFGERVSCAAVRAQDLLFRCR